MAESLKYITREHNSGYDGNSGKGRYIYKLNATQFIKINYTTDSYDGNMEIQSVQVVTGKEKTVVVYE